MSIHTHRGEGDKERDNEGTREAGRQGAGERAGGDRLASGRGREASVGR